MALSQLAIDDKKTSIKEVRGVITPSNNSQQKPQKQQQIAPKNINNYKQS